MLLQQSLVARFHSGQWPDLHSFPSGQGCISFLSLRQKKLLLVPFPSALASTRHVQVVMVQKVLAALVAFCTKARQ
jgi:hypothetical protein